MLGLYVNDTNYQLIISFVCTRKIKLLSFFFIFPKFLLNQSIHLWRIITRRSFESVDKIFQSFFITHLLFFFLRDRSKRWKIRSWYGATLASLGPVRFLENHRHKLCMQVVGIVRPLTSAGPDDKLLHIEIFGANEGTKFEYRSSRFSFSRLPLSLTHTHTQTVLASFLFFSAIPTAYLRPQWFSDLIYRTISLVWEKLHTSNDFLSGLGYLYILFPCRNWGKLMKLLIVLYFNSCVVTACIVQCISLDIYNDLILLCICCIKYYMFTYGEFELFC